MKFTDEEQQIIRRGEAIISAKLPGTDYLTSPDMVRSFLRLHFASADRELFWGAVSGQPEWCNCF